MAGYVDDVVGAAHDPDVAILVHDAGVAGAVPAGEVGQVGGAVALVVLPQRRAAAGGKRELEGQVAGFTAWQDFPVVVEGVQVVAGAWAATGAGA